MAQKRKAKEAFSGQSSQLSAAAAARQARLSKEQPRSNGVENADELVASSIAGIPYDGHHISGDEDEGSAAISKKVIPTIQLSTWIRTPDNVSHDDDDGQFQFCLEKDKTATFIGEYDLEVLEGVVTICGAMIHPDLGPQRVYALSTHALPTITARNDSIIRLTSIKSGLLKLSKLSPLFRNIGAAKGSPSFQLLSSTNDDSLQRPLVPLEIDKPTKNILSRLNAKLDNPTAPSPPTFLAIGPKSSGKSTFNRFLCNMITSRPNSTKTCLYLDLDPGQPEFTPPGQISLIEIRSPILGPPYTHPAATHNPSFRLLRAHTLAATTFKDDADHYLACAADLLAHIPKDAQTPIVINSCGWTTGQGASTLLSLCALLPSPPEVVLLGEPPNSELARSLPSASGPPHTIPRRAHVQSVRTPAEQRAMATMSYLHQQKNASSKKKGVDVSWFSKPLSTQPAWRVPFDSTVIVSYGQSPHPDFLSEVLDGSVVALVSLSSSLKETKHTAAENLPYSPAETPLDASSSEFLGLALIRGIDVERRTLQLLSPVEIELDGKALVLVRGGFDSPDWAYLEDLYAGGEEAKGVERPWVAKERGEDGMGRVWRVRRPPLVGGGK